MSIVIAKYYHNNIVSDGKTGSIEVQSEKGRIIKYMPSRIRLDGTKAQQDACAVGEG